MNISVKNYQEVTFLKNLSFIEYYWKYNCGNRKDLSSALRQLAIGKPKAPESDNPESSTSASVCELCTEMVSKRIGFGNRRFGILENCDHVFCLFCIRAYRHLALAQKLPKEDADCKSCTDEPLPQTVACPVCGLDSGVVVSSWSQMAGPDSRAAYVIKFKEDMKTINCPWYRCGQGQCMYPEKCVMIRHQQ